MHRVLLFVCLCLLNLTITNSISLAAMPPVVSTEWLLQNKDNPNLVLLDATNTFDYLEGHIPGAISASFKEEDAISQDVIVSYGGGVDLFTDTDSPIPFQDLPGEKMQEIFRAWGINPDSIVVVYDKGAGMYATRLMYSLRFWGVENSALLDGGSTRWTALGNTLSQDIPAVKPGTMTVGAPDSSMLADTDEVLTAIGDPASVRIIDALGHSYHYGEKIFYSRQGHIPYAISIPRDIYFNPDKTLKTAEEIKEILAFHGITPDQKLYVQCGGGIAASMPFFAAHFVAQLPNVKLYRGSLIAWEYDQRTLPLWQYDTPYRLRDSAWVNLWAGLRNRTLGTVHTSLLDIRSAEEYAKGHPPFAISIPYEEWLQHVDNPEQIAQRLGAAGADQAHEAVVFGKGVGKEAALVAWMLEYVGQAKTSIAVDDMSNWSSKGGKATTDAVEVRPRQMKFDLALPPTHYTAQAVSMVRASENESKTHAFPQVFVASGETQAARQALSSGSKVVHLPASQTLRQAGGLKSAADLYKHFMVDNELPRLAEIICYADDPADAALNWFALTMIGYPNVKVML